MQTLHRIERYFGERFGDESEEERLIDALEELRQCDRVLLEVTRDMRESDVYKMADFIRGLKNAD